MIFYFLRHILKIIVYEVIEFKVTIFICEFLALIFLFFSYFSHILLINY